MANREDNLPGVSIIVPVYNNQGCIAALIESLLEQDYPKQLLEIIIVDNNSTDATKKIIGEYPVKLLEEKQIQSSYAARNRGIENAACEILAFIDSDCIASKGWITQGVKVLSAEKADLVGGKVEFIYSPKQTTAELLDSIAHMDPERTIEQNGAAATANLFVRANVFANVGLFPDTVKSGGDIQWTGNATQQGFSLIFAPQAIVKHPARNLKEILSKRFRTGTGKAHILLGMDKPLWYIVLYTFYYLVYIPVPWTEVKNRIKRRGTPRMKDRLVRMVAVMHLCMLASRLGAFTELIHIMIKKLFRIHPTRH